MAMPEKENTMFKIDTKDTGVGGLKVNLQGARDASTFKIDVKLVDQRDSVTHSSKLQSKKSRRVSYHHQVVCEHIPGGPFQVKMIGNNTSTTNIDDGGDEETPTQYSVASLKPRRRSRK